MSCAKPYIGCKIGLISKAQNRYEGILYTIDKVNSTVVLAKVICFGTEGRPTDRPTPPKDGVYEYITFRGSDIKDITLCEPPRSHHGLPPDPAIVQVTASCLTSSGIYSACGPFSPLRMPAYNQLAASSLLNQQYAAALGLGFHVRRGPMVEKAVQTLHPYPRIKISGRRGGGPREPEERVSSPEWALEPPVRIQVAVMKRQNVNSENKSRRRRNRRRGQLMVASVPSATLRFDTDFDFDSSNAQFIKEELEREVHHRVNMKEAEDKVKEELRSSKEDDHGPKCYYNKAKSFFDNISSDKKLRLTWAEERKRNLETFGVPGRFLRGQGFRGGYGRRGRGTVQAQPSYTTRNGQV
uniref:Uncharacterized protein n=1 Tax=Mola mola TaxID=94237 RepID=A0A3Q3WWB2_MOLML